jgi:polar amino acid transport system ATP-binding protein
MVKAEQVHKSFGSLDVLKGIDLEVAPGDVMCLIGPSGSGKSTFLRLINHLEKLDAGRLWVDGELVGYRQQGDKLYELKDREVCAKRAEIGMVFQRFNLFPHLSVLDNVTIGPVKVRGQAAAEAKERAGQLLERVGLKDKISAYPSQLSGGQQQRVAIARAFAAQPPLILADEPTGSLDRATGQKIVQLLRAAATQQQATVLVVTHDERVANQADRRFEIEDGVLTEME